eukprot:4262443-Amphidinium_carterae.1
MQTSPCVPDMPGGSLDAELSQEDLRVPPNDVPRNGERGIKEPPTKMRKKERECAAVDDGIVADDINIPVMSLGDEGQPPTPPRQSIVGARSKMLPRPWRGRPA